MFAPSLNIDLEKLRQPEEEPDRPARKVAPRGKAQRPKTAPPTPAPPA